MIPRTEELYRQISTLYHDGLSMSAIARIINCSPPSVRKILTELSQRKRNRRNRRTYVFVTGRAKSKRTELLWASGYAYVWMPDYHRKHFNNWAKRADLELEKKLRRLLLPNEIAHHKNEVRSDDSADNLEAMDSVEHNRMHAYR